MLTTTAVHTPPMDQVCWQIRVDDFSVRAANWCHLELGSKEGFRLRLPAPFAHGSGGAESPVAEWPKTPDEWRGRLQQQTATKEAFVPKTELGRKLWALRQKYIAEGGRLYAAHEVAEELERHQRGLD